MSPPPLSARQDDRPPGGARGEAFERPGPAEVSLSDFEVHVWLATLDPAPEPLDRLWQCLSREERARADGFRIRRDRDAYVAGRGMLRGLLGRYLGRAAEGITFSIGAHGKPAIRDASGRERLRFNVSHSGGLALFAVASGREVGVDLERIRPDVATSGLAERFFSSEEISALALLRGEEREAAFFSCWTRKEAYAKARGEGLSLPLRSFSVTIEPDGEPALTGCGGKDAELGRWTFRDVRPGPQWAATLVAEGRDWKLRRWRWTPA